MTKEQKRIETLESALYPFAKIADEYDNDGLDEARPDWVRRGIAKFDPEQELYAGRGGKTLITLDHILNARDAYTGKIHERPKHDARIMKIRQMYEASIPNLPWDEMSEERRNEIISNYEKFL